MGRMADARKRAKVKKAEETPAQPEAAAEPLVFPAEERAGVEAPAAPAASEAPEPAGEWVARDEALVFPAEPVSPPTSGLALAPSPAATSASVPRLSLPASGLAEDILRALESRPRPAETPAAAGELPPPPPPEAAAAGPAQNFSFFSAPAREEKKAVEAQEHLATFFLAGEEYGVDVRLVQEIIRVTEITPVPRAPVFIRGVINLRGRIIPVVDLRRKLELGSVEVSGKARIVVVKLRDRLVGLLVDGASQVLKVLASSIEPPPEEVLEAHASAIRGVAKLADRLIILLDLMKVLALELREASVESA